MDLTPEPHVLFSMQNQNLPWHKVLAELIDNALDAGANNVTIRFDRGCMTVEDNGRGIRDIQASLKLGGHHESETTVLGKYGIGLKDAWLFCGDEMHIMTVHKGVRSTVSIDRQELARNRWQVADPIVEETDAPQGTSIRLKTTKRKPPFEAWERLAWIFTPALLDGKQIRQRNGSADSPLQPKQLPPLEKAIADSFLVQDKAVDIHIGVMQENHRIYSGPFWIQYGHRHIGSGSIGVGDYSTQGMAGVIKLGKGWTLTKNKDDISELREELADEIHKRIEPLLKEAQEASQTVFISQLRMECESILNQQLLEHLREARTKPSISQGGTVLAVGSGKRRRNATKVHDADGSVVRLKSGNGGKIKIDFNQLDNPNSAAIFDPSDNRVILNIDHVFVAKAQAAGNRPAIVQLAVIALHQHAMGNRDGNRLAFPIDDPVTSLGQLLNGIAGVFDEAAS
jgi:hypothetical protein